MDASEPTTPPHFPLPTQTRVTEQGGGHLFDFDGLLPLPIGTRINLDNLDNLDGEPQISLDPERFPTGHADAVVVNVRIWGTQDSSRLLVLEVELTEAGDTGTWMVDH